MFCHFEIWRTKDPKHRPFQRSRLWIVLLGMFALQTFPACDGGEAENADFQRTNLLESPSEAIPEGPQPDFIDQRGNRYIWVAKASFVSSPEDAIGEVPTGEMPTVDSLPKDPETLAAALRPRILKNGHEYIGEPDLKMAEDILAGFQAPQTLGHRGTLPDVSRATTSDLEQRESAYVIGNDDRYYVGTCERLNYPASTTGLLSGGGKCTAFLIGPHTALTAAHCLYSNGWLPPVTFAPAQGAISCGAPAQPFGSFAPSFRGVPNGFVSWSSTPEWDFAFLDFGNPNPPGNFGIGWVGTFDAGGSSGTTVMYGYGPLPGQTIPQMAWRQGTVYVDVWDVFAHNLDTVGGDSGAALLRTLSDGYPYAMAIQSGEKYTWVTYNTARRWNGAAYSFVHTYGNWP